MINNECPICHRIINSNNRYNICKDCMPSILNYNKSKKQTVSYCNKHGFYCADVAWSKCPICKKENISKTCIICGNKFIKHNKNKYDICDSCANKLPGKKDGFIMHCKLCGSYYKTFHNFQKCPVCHNISIIKICKNCGEKFLTHSSQIVYCDKCKNEINKSKSVIAYEKLVKNKDSIIKNGLILMPIKNPPKKNAYGRSYKPKYCIHCGRLFIPSSPFQNGCNACYLIKKCDNCGRLFIRLRQDGSPLNYIKDGKQFCSRTCNSVNAYKNGLIFIDEHKNIPEVKNKSKKYDASLNKIINESNINDFDKIPGIWYEYDIKNNIVLDVCLTTNIKREYNKFISKMHTATKGKYARIKKLGNVVECRFLSTIDSWNDGLKKEYLFATKVNALYWNPAPGDQTKWVKEGHI
jgi:hypothetical protein